MDLAPYDNIVSLGEWCAPAHNIRLRFGITKAMPFDWSVTSYNGTIKLLEDRFANLVDPANLAISPDAASVHCRYYDIVHHHDFAHDEHGRINPDLAPQVADVRAKFRHVTGRFFNELRGKRVLFIRTGLNATLWWQELGTPYPHATPEEHAARAKALQQLVRRQTGAAEADLLMLESLPEGTVFHLEGGSVYFADLGPRISEQGMWEDNYNAIFDRFGIRLAGDPEPPAA